MPRPRRSPEELFDTGYTVSPSGCWVWTRNRTMVGYGRVYTGNKAHVLAHRYSWTKFRGPIPEGMFVCHRCDNPACVNPDHLFLGTPAENVRDAAKKGRTARQQGEQHGMAKLSADDVLAIRSSDAPGRELAEQYGISASHVSALRHRTFWSHL